jgi:RHS repeat-associated protein
VEVDEPNAVGATVAPTGCPGTGEAIWVTNYAIDALGNLTNVLQNGSRPRSFTYDSLSRLQCSSNPESATAACPAFGAAAFPAGTLSYIYNPDGIVVKKTDARSISTSYTYDALHRELTRTYSDGTPTVTTAYDQSSCLGLPACQNIGRRTSMTDAAGSEAWAYEVAKTQYPDWPNIEVDQRTTGGVTKTGTYYSDLAGNIIIFDYPTDRSITNAISAANRIEEVYNGPAYAISQYPASPGCPINVVCYTPQGTIYSMALYENSTFSGLNILETYNSRLQPQEIKVSSTGGNAMDLIYNYTDPVNGGNAGHVFSITNNLNNSRTQNFTYDQLNRITSAGTFATTGSYCWGYQYTYDAWANLTSQSGWTPNYNGCTETVMTPVTADGNNHISAFSYDAAGNATSETGYAYTWDAESQLKTDGTFTMLYDGDGRRVAEAAAELYWYGPNGQILGITDASGTTQSEYVYLGSRRLEAISGTQVRIYASDSRGSARIITDNTGVVYYDADFTPFGGERAYTDSYPTLFKFEGKIRDYETGNDDFGARYYSNRFGRWLSADWSNVPVAVPYANLTNPQTLNLYSMVADDPESFADLDGHMSQPGQAGDGCSDIGGGDCLQREIQNSASMHAENQNSGINDTEATLQNLQQDAEQQEAQNQNGDQNQQNQQPTNQNQEKKQDQENDQQKTPLGAGSGGGGRRQPRGGERGKSSKPESWKHTRPSKDHPGQYEVHDHQTGKWVLKPKGWSPNTQRVILGVEVGITAYVIYRVVRMLPSLLPPLWETIPLNAAVP